MTDEPSAEDNVAAALKGAFAKASDDEPTETAERDEAVAEDATEEQVSDETTEVEAEAETSQGAETDDVADLKGRLAEREAALKRYEEQLAAVTERSNQSLETVRRKALRYASERDKARQVLEKALSADGVDKAEAERLLNEIRAGYNPESANYAPAPEPERGGDDRDLLVNQFLIDRRFTNEEAESFAAYLRNPANLTPADARIQDVYSLLSVVEPRWRTSSKTAEKPDDTVRAVKTVQAVQRRAAKAAAAGAGASKTNVGKRASQNKSPRLSDGDLTSAIQDLMRG